MTKVSVIIPIYNAARYLPLLMEDLYVQNYTDSEYILVNDGSTDDSLEIINAFIYQKHDERYRVVTQNNQGVSAARNTGLSLAKGEYIIFIDSDDRLDRFFLESYVKAIAKNKTDIELFSCLKIDNHETLKPIDKTDYTLLSKIGKFDGSTYLKYLSSGLIQGYPFTYIFKRSLWEGVHFDTNLKYQEDQFAISQIVINTPNIVIHANKESYYYYYIRDDSAVRSLSASSLQDVIEMDFRTIEMAMNSKNVNVPEKELNQILVISYWRMLVLSVWQNDNYTFKIAKDGFVEYVPKTYFASRKEAMKRWEQFILLRLGLDDIVKKILNK